MGTKGRSEDPQQLVPTQNWKKQKPKAKAKPKRKDKNKIEQLLDEFLEQGLDPGKTVVCQLEFPRGRNAIGKWHPRFAEDLKLTLDMVTCKEKISFVMSGENKVIVTFEGEPAKDPFENVVVDEEAKLGEESGLVKDVPIGAHFIDLYGAGRWKFQVPLLNSAKVEQERLRKEKEKAEKEKAERERKEKAEQDRLRREKEKAERAERIR